MSDKIQAEIIDCLVYWDVPQVVAIKTKHNYFIGCNTDSEDLDDPEWLCAMVYRGAPSDLRELLLEAPFCGYQVDSRRLRLERCDFINDSWLPSPGFDVSRHVKHLANLPRYSWDSGCFMCASHPVKTNSDQE